MIVANNDKKKKKDHKGPIIPLLHFSSKDAQVKPCYATEPCNRASPYPLQRRLAVELVFRLAMKAGSSADRRAALALVGRV